MAVQNITTGETREEEATQGLADSGFVPVDTTQIDSDSLRNEPNLGFDTFEEPTPFDVSKIEVPELQLTEPEQQQVGLEDQLSRLERGLLGESSFRAGQEETVGLPELQATQTDLTSQLKAIQNESLAIPMQLQQDSTGRGITRGGLAPIQAGRLRANAISALTTSALLEASRGNIATAQDQVDRAVSQKYDPIRERIAVTERNLQRIIDSPRTSIADKNRAEQQLVAQSNRLREIQKQEAVEKEINNIAVQAAQAGLNAETLNRIRNAGTLVEATQIAQEAGLFETTKERETIKLGENEYLYDKDTGELLAATGSAPPSELELAKLGLEEMKTRAGLEKTQAEISKIYNDIEKDGQVDPISYQKNLLEIRKLEQDLNKKQGDIDKERIAAGQEVTVIEDKLSAIDELLGHSGMNTAVGVTPLGRVPVLDFVTGNKMDFVAGVNQLISQETLDTLVALKSRGGTLGALSQTELTMLQNAASKFGTWINKDGTGFRTTTGKVKEELEKIREHTQKLLTEARRTATTENVGTEATPGGEYSW